ncbi:hypothetical protein JW905_06410, partial [bacterium]|nr:hypothetical protein [candidate division CSSED10-310 bacterium]
MNRYRPQHNGTGIRQSVYLILTVTGILLLVSCVYAVTPVTTHNDGFDSDGRFYAAMARGPFSNDPMTRNPPFCWRVLAPCIVHLLPWDTLDGFRKLA